MSNFKKGDVVALKSGGPSMTVYKIEYDEVYTTWFDNGQQKYGNFIPEIIEEVDDSIDYDM